MLDGPRIPLGRLASAILTDPKSPDPVIPPDLHLVKAVNPDADGTVPCVYCGTRVPFASAQVLGSQGFTCGAHSGADPTFYSTAQPEISPNLVIKRRLWPWVVGIGVLVAGGGAFMGWRFHVGKQRELAEQFPESLSDAEQDIVDANLDRWKLEPLAKAVNNPPPLDKLHLGAACDVTVDNWSATFEYDRDTVPVIKQKLQGLLDAAERGRYYNVWEKAVVVNALHRPVLALAYKTRTGAQLTDDSIAKTEFEAGQVTGKAYLFDPDGTLRCAGEFIAESSESVDYTYTKTDYDSTDEQAHLRGWNRDGVNDKLQQDLAAQTDKAISAALRKVQ